MGINAHRALFRAGADDTLHSNLTVDDGDRTVLREVRDEIRATLKEGFRDWTRILDRRKLFDSVALATFAADAEPVLSPKFRMQGSWSYFTLNRSTQEPPQEIDLDDGVFLPVSFLSQGGRTHPAIISGAYFEAVETILAPLCDKRRWTLARMPSCVRVEVRDGAHVDLALYAIPDDDFLELVEKAEAASARFDAAMDDQLRFSDAIYSQLPSDQIMLAHREQGWKPSDPRKLEDWFQEAVGKHGEQLRRVCRFLKGWRDFHWDCCRLSSIALMACAVTAFDEFGRISDQARDDKAMLMAAGRLSTLLEGRIENPVIPGQYLDEKWTPEMRDDFIAHARELERSIRDALDSRDTNYASGVLRAALGIYMPDDPALLSVEIGAPMLSTGMLKDFGRSDGAREAVKLGGDDRLG